MRRQAVAAVALLLAAGAAGCSEPEGPLRGKADGTVFDARIGDRLFWGPLRLQVGALDPAQIEGIEAISDNPEVRVERVWRDVSADPTGGGGRDLKDKFGPGDLVDAKDLGIAPKSFASGDPTLLVLQFRPPTKAGPYAWRGFRIRYRARGRDHVLVVDGPSTACVDVSRAACV